MCSVPRVGANLTRGTETHDTSIRFCEIHFRFRGFAADDTGPVCIGLVQGDVARGGFGVFFHPGFTLFRFAPPGESPTVFENLFQLIIRLGVVDVRIAEGGCALQE